MPLHDSNGTYNRSTYIEGDFTASLDYYLELIKNTKMTEKITTDKNGKVKHGYKNTAFDVLNNSCILQSFAGLKKGVLPDGTSFGDFVKWDGLGSNRPFDFMHMIEETFFNNQITKDKAREDVKTYASKSYRWPLSKNYYNRGQKYAKMIGVA